MTDEMIAELYTTGNRTSHTEGLRKVFEAGRVEDVRVAEEAKAEKERVAALEKAEKAAAKAVPA